MTRYIYHYTAVDMVGQLRGGMLNTAFPVVSPDAYKTVRKMVQDAENTEHGNGGRLVSLSFLHAIAGEEPTAG